MHQIIVKNHILFLEIVDKQFGSQADYSNNSPQFWMIYSFPFFRNKYQTVDLVKFRIFFEMVNWGTSKGVVQKKHDSWTSNLIWTTEV